MKLKVRQANKTVNTHITGHNIQTATVSSGFHFAKIKAEKCAIQIWRKENRTKEKPKKLTSEQMYFYQSKEASSTSSL